MKRIIPLLCFTFTQLSSMAGSTHPEEAGKVSWRRDLDAALISSKETGKPVFALFQEIPGCAGCKQFGREVLSVPLLVEAIETEFIPLLIHNNKPGKDAAVLQRFGEPAWNYQVVRFLDADAKDIIPRKDQVWETGPLAERMIATLTITRRPVPAYLKLLASEHSTQLKQAAFVMGCFWTGELSLGQIEGVITTEAGFIAGREVVLLQYDPNLISLPKLIAAAEKVNCAEAVHVPVVDLDKAPDSRLSMATLSGYRTAPLSDQKKQLGGTAAQTLNLTGAQATKVNAWIRSDTENALQYLAPSQRKLLQAFKKK
jgi:hypothetical protein